jgi:Ni,Fe-hydrogenase III small subunit
MIKVYRINTGSCGGCDLEIESTVAHNADLEWADTPADADVLLLTGPLTLGSRPAFMAIWNEHGARIPLLAVGRCAIDGRPFGHGGLAAAPEIRARLMLDGCPPAPKAIVEAIRQVVKG